MPFDSLAQEGFAHEHPEKFGGAAVVKEFDEATKGKKLPKRKHPKPEVKKEPVVRMRHTAKPRG
jgi:hypothetical protein